MEKLTIKTPSDVLSFIGHTLGFWPQESMVCINLNNNSVGATLRVDLPRQPGQELPYARTVAHYLTSDTAATSLLFALYTSELPRPGQPKPHAGTIAALAGVLAEQGITIRDGLFVGNETFSPYDGEPGTSLALPVSSTRPARSTPKSPSPPPATKQPKRPPSNTTWTPSGPGPWGDATRQARQLWAGMLDSVSFPSEPASPTPPAQ